MRLAAARFARDLSATSRRSTPRACAAPGSPHSSRDLCSAPTASRWQRRPAGCRAGSTCSGSTTNPHSPTASGWPPPTVWARDLANTPARTKTPAWLADQAAEANSAQPASTSTSATSIGCAEHGFGGVLAVGAGSASPPRLIEATWRPRGARPGVHVVLVGKGITFDTGGLNIKPGDAMRMMHTDMSGAAAVLAALRAVAQARVPVRVTALGAGGRELGFRLVVPPRRRGPPRRRSHQRDHQHRRRGTARAGRRAGLRGRAAAARRARRHRHPDRCDEGRARAAHRRAVRHLRRLAAPSSRRARPRTSRCGGCRCTTTTRRRLDSDIADADNAPGNPGAITAALFLRPFTGRTALGAPRHRRPGARGRGRRRAQSGRHRVRRAAARPLGRVAGLTRVIRRDWSCRSSSGSSATIRPHRTDALEAAARAASCSCSPRTSRSGRGRRRAGTASASARWCAAPAARSGAGAEQLPTASTCATAPPSCASTRPIPTDAWPPRAGPAAGRWHRTRRSRAAGTAAPRPAAGAAVAARADDRGQGDGAGRACRPARLACVVVGGPGALAGRRIPLAVRDATQEQWAEAVRRGMPVVHDGGFTEVEPGTQTALAVLPWPVQRTDS